MAAVHGDDLGDEFALDDFVADISGGEDGAVSPSDDEDHTGSPGAIPTAAGPSNRPPGEDPLRARKRKRREKDKEKRAKKRRMVEILEVKQQASVAEQSPAVLAEFLLRMQAKTYSKMTAMELEDIRIPESAIADTTLWTAPRTLDQLVDFIIKAVPVLKTRLGQRPKDFGAPTVLFISAGALRVTDVTRVMKSKTLRGEKGGDVAKLFARHFKLEDHVSYLRRARIGAAVGTPGRIGKLLCETDALSVSALTHIILDASFRDVKKRSLFDIPENRDELFSTVFGAESIRQGIKRGKIQVVFF